MPLPKWNDVAAPDFSSSMQGLQMFSNLLTQGLNTARVGFQEFDKTKSDQVNKAIAMQLAALNDPTTSAEQARAIIAAADPNRISMENVNRANTVTGDIQGRAVQDINFKKTTDAYAREQRNTAALQAAAPQFDAFRQALKTNDPTKINLAMTSLDKALGDAGMTAVDRFNFDDKLIGRQRTEFDIARGYTEAKRSDTRWDWAVRDDGQGQQAYQERQTAAEIAGRLRLGGYTDQDEIYRALKTDVDSGKINGRVANIVASELGLTALPSDDPADGVDYTGGLGGGGGSVPSGGGAGTPQQHMEMASEFKNLGFDESTAAAFVGNSMIEGGYTGGQGDGGTAAGHFQWRGVRRENFRKIIGKDPSKATPAESAKFVAWEFKNPASSGAFVPKNGLSPQQQVQAILSEKDPGKKAALIDIYYERSDGKARNSRVAAANKVSEMIAGRIVRAGSNTQVQAANMQDNYLNSVPSKFAELSGKNDTKPFQVAARIAKEVPGVDARWVEKQITALQAHVTKNGGDRNVLNAEIAGQIVLDNLYSNANGLSDRFFGERSSDTTNYGGFGSWLLGSSNGKYLNSDAAKKTALAYANGDMDSAIKTNVGRATAVTARDKYEAQIAALEARIARKQNAARRRGGRADTSVEERDLAALQALASKADEVASGFGLAPNRGGSALDQILGTISAFNRGGR